MRRWRKCTAATLLATLPRWTLATWQLTTSSWVGSHVNPSVRSATNQALMAMTTRAAFFLRSRAYSLTIGPRPFYSKTSQGSSSAAAEKVVVVPGVMSMSIQKPTTIIALALVATATPRSRWQG